MRLLLITAIVMICGQPAKAERPAIVRVEEDWELNVELPEANINAPQITCVMAPTGNTAGFYAAFEINHHTQPDYAAGGLQLVGWSGGFAVTSSSWPGNAQFQQSAETVRWTQQVSLQDGRLTIEVVNGTSDTWGSFGDNGTLKVACPTTLEDLIDYATDVTVEHSGVGFAGNRVSSLVLREVRWYTASGLVARDTATHVVHPKP